MISINPYRDNWYQLILIYVNWYYQLILININWYQLRSIYMLDFVHLLVGSIMGADAPGGRIGPLYLVPWNRGLKMAAILFLLMFLMTSEPFGKNLIIFNFSVICWVLNKECKTSIDGTVNTHQTRCSPIETSAWLLR